MSLCFQCFRVIFVLYVKYFSFIIKKPMKIHKIILISEKPQISSLNYYYYFPELILLFDFLGE